MKKLTIICAVALVLNMMAGPVLADSFRFDFNGDQSWDTTWDLDPSTNETVAMDIYFADYSPTTDMFLTAFFLHYDNTKVQVNMGNSAIDNSCWDSTWNTLIDLGGGVIYIGCANLACCPVTGGKIKIATIELECIAEDLVGSTISTTYTGTPTGFTSDCNSVYLTTTHASATLYGVAKWHKVTVDTDGGDHTSLALDSGGNPCISYYDLYNDTLKYARCITGCGDPVNWSTVSVIVTGDTDVYTSLALYGGAWPRISYFDDVNDDLKYAWCDTVCSQSISWHTITVDSIGDVGHFPSLALDSSGRPRISYYGDTNLKYAWCDTGCSSKLNWTYIRIDIPDDVGVHPSLALDSSDRPRISYIDMTNDTLKYAWCNTGCDDPGNWSKITLDNVGGPGAHPTSLALDSSDRPRISYIHTTNNTLKYAWCNTGCDDPGNWSKITLASVGTQGWSNSLALDSSNRPRISYEYGISSDHDLKYTWCDILCTNPSNWDTITVDDTQFVGYWNSLALDSNDNPRISYWDGLNDDLKYASPDSDGDEFFDYQDNAPETPNGPGGGTCVKEISDMICSTGVTCDDIYDCGSGEECQKEQGDCNDNDIGDACECYGDITCDGWVQFNDLKVMKREYNSTGCDPVSDPCYADLNGDGWVQFNDLKIKKFEYNKSGCPIRTGSPPCEP